MVSQRQDHIVRRLRQKSTKNGPSVDHDGTGGPKNPQPSDNHQGTTGGHGKLHVPAAEHRPGLHLHSHHARLVICRFSFVIGRLPEFPPCYIKIFLIGKPTNRYCIYRIGFSKIIVPYALSII